MWKAALEVWVLGKSFWTAELAIKCVIIGCRFVVCGSISGCRGTCKHIIHVTGRQAVCCYRKHHHLCLPVLLVPLQTPRKHQRDQRSSDGLRVAAAIPFRLCRSGTWSRFIKWKVVLRFSRPGAGGSALELPDPPETSLSYFPVNWMQKRQRYSRQLQFNRQQN